MYTWCPAGLITQAARTVQISLGLLLEYKVSVNKYLFHCRECALKHYVQLVTACPPLGVHKSVLFLQELFIKPVKECRLVECSSLLGQTWLHCWHQVQSHPCVAGTSTANLVTDLPAFI